LTSASAGLTINSRFISGRHEAKDQTHLPKKALPGESNVNIQPDLLTNYTDLTAGPVTAWNIVGNYLPTNPGLIGPFDQTYNSIITYLNYGSQGPPPVAGKGAAGGIASVVTVLNCADGLSEITLYGGYLNFANNNYAFGNTTPGRAWGFDIIIEGAITTQQSALSGFHMLVNNHFNGPTLDDPSGAYWAITRPGTGPGVSNQGLLNYPVAVGFGVVGFGSGPTALGFMTGIQVGGRGSNWGVARSHLTLGADISDYGGIGVYIHRKYSGITGVTVNMNGANYTTNPPVNFTGGGITPATGYQASGVGILSPTSVANNFTVTPGSGYATAPTVTIDPPFPGGAGTSTATAHAIVNPQGQVTAVILDSAGSGYTTVPGVTLSGGGGLGATASIRHR
jgi:hypothetical protein